MTDVNELERLAIELPLKPLDDPAVLDEAGRKLRIEWPDDYVRLLSNHDGVEGDVGEWNLILFAAKDLLDNNDAAFMEFFPGLVMVGGDGGGELVAFDRSTGEVLLVPMIGAEEDWLVLGKNFTEALQRMERGAVFDAPHRSGPK